MRLFFQSLVTILMVSFLFGNNLAAQSGADGIVGTWLVPEKDGKVEIYKQGDAYFGKIVWLEKPNNADGTPRKDVENEDESLRNQTIQGLVILKNFKYDAGDKEWVDGTVYNSRSGKTYTGYLKLQKDGSLYLKGFIAGMRWLGKSNVWTRVK